MIAFGVVAHLGAVAGRQWIENGWWTDDSLGQLLRSSDGHDPSYRT